MIVVTGSAGFIGSCLVRKLNDEQFTNILLVDDFSNSQKNINLKNKKYADQIHRSQFINWLIKNGEDIEMLFHLGARTDTTGKDPEIFDHLNLNYSKSVWQWCSQFKIPLIYASSAATYGLGEDGFEDNHKIVTQLHPLNLYGESKNDFDRWVLQQEKRPPYWVGLKFFNVYGPNEYHKGRMASVIFHTVKQIQATGQMKLFRSHREDVKDGEQSRDFIYVKDVVDVCYFLMQNKVENGLYNLGTGQARTFWDLAVNTFQAMGLEPNITFIDTPADIRDTYQYFTEANMNKLRNAGYDRSFYSLEEGIGDYVKNYLLEKKVW